jgi:V8-like Glu-specific endopeptidase
MRGAGFIALVGAAALTASACAEPEPAVEIQHIVGGSPTEGDLAVVMVSTADGQCTGSLVAPTVVLTAAHCISHSIATGRTAQGRVYFGSRVGQFFDDRRIIDMIAHRYYTSGIYSGYDIGLVRLQSPAPAEIEPLPLNLQPLDQDFVGATVRTIGFGYSDGNQNGFGVKRQVNLVVKGVTSEFLVVGDETANTCQGDSGGPSLLDTGGTEVIAAVTSFGAGGCLGESRITRADVFVDDLLHEVIDAWSGPCRDDGVCVTEGCRTPDPDCDPMQCGLDGVCGQGCARLDLDCPVTGMAGDLCDDSDGCESRLCVEAPEDARVGYCSQPCDGGCPNPINRCDDGVCRYQGVTPSVQGAPCTAGDDCRSGLCDPGPGICVEPCASGADCAEGLSCRDVEGVSACTVPRSGGCHLGPAAARNGGGALAAGLGLLLVLFAAVRRRRRSQEE